MLDRSPDEVIAAKPSRAANYRAYRAKKAAEKEAAQQRETAAQHEAPGPQQRESLAQQTETPVALAPAESPPVEEFQPQPETRGSGIGGQSAESLRQIGMAAAAHGEPESATASSIDISRPPKRLPVRTKGIWQTLSEPLGRHLGARGGIRSGV
jgi:hypothetical protein